MLVLRCWEVLLHSDPTVTWGHVGLCVQELQPTSARSHHVHLPRGKVSLQPCSFSRVSHLAFTLPKGSDFFLEASNVIGEFSLKQGSQGIC